MGRKRLSLMTIEEVEQEIAFLEECDDWSSQEARRYGRLELLREALTEDDTEDDQMQYLLELHAEAEKPMRRDDNPSLRWAA